MGIEGNQASFSLGGHRSLDALNKNVTEQPGKTEKPAQTGSTSGVGDVSSKPPVGKGAVRIAGLSGALTGLDQGNLTLDRHQVAKDPQTPGRRRASSIGEDQLPASSSQGAKFQKAHVWKGHTKRSGVIAGSSRLPNGIKNKINNMIEGAKKAKTPEDSAQIIMNSIDSVGSNRGGIDGKQLKEQLESALLDNNLLDDLSMDDQMSIISHLTILGDRH